MTFPAATAGSETTQPGGAQRTTGPPRGSGEKADRGARVPTPSGPESPSGVRAASHYAGVAMGKKKIIGLAASLAVLAGAAITVTLLTGSKGPTHPVDPARLQADIAAKLPPGWTDKVTADSGKVWIELTHGGDAKDTLRAIRAEPIVNPNKPEMRKLLPQDVMAAEYVIEYTDTADKGTTLIRAYAGKGHHPAPELQLVSKEIISAGLALP